MTASGYGGDGVTSFLRTWMIQPVGSRHAWWSDNLFRLGMVFCHNILLLESLLDVVLLSTSVDKSPELFSGSM